MTLSSQHSASASALVSATETARRVRLGTPTSISSASGGANSSEADFIRNLVYGQAGIVLEASKHYFVETRLAPVLEKNGFASIGEMVAQMRKKPSAVMYKQVVEALTNNETNFFRDRHPFDALRKEIIPALMERRAAHKTISIWSAACSSGQEPYSIAMTLDKYFPQLKDWRVSITATDLDTTILARAASGVYSQIEVNRGLPAPFLLKYFENRGIEWHVKPDLKKLIRFKQLNLMSNYVFPQRFDIILMRNVLIYFNIEAKRTILDKISKVMQPDGYLMLGGAETTVNISKAFTREQFGRAGCYRLKG